MAICEKCGKPLILSGGKCLYCGAVPGRSSEPGSASGEVKKSRPIVQRRTAATRDGQSPYSDYAGKSRIPGAKTDRYGNPQGSQYDLAKDGAFRGYKIVVLYLCCEGDMVAPKKALERKGFEVVVLDAGASCQAARLRKELDSDQCQLWIVSDRQRYLPSDCLNLVYEHFRRGRGLYVWSDNDPFFADSNVILEELFDATMSGFYQGDQLLTIQAGRGEPGIIPDHAITTGLQYFYEGITISNVRMSQVLNPLVYSSDRLVVTAYYDFGGLRALVDGGFTRLYYKWDSAGTDRFVVNCASWLANIERFGYRPSRRFPF